MKKLNGLKNVSMLILLMLVFHTTSHAQTTMEEFMMKWENGKKLTLAVVETMPDDLQNYKPHETAMSFSEQVTHLSSAIVGISGGFLMGEESGIDLEKIPSTKAELKAHVEACYDYGKATFSKLTEAQLAEKIDIFGNNASRRQVLGLIDDHCTHHRGAAISYIRANGIEPPRFTAF
ncbi:DinB family protein [Belliella kenyensis]|uniref:DinB family protein n=2 Tax=Belliella kenyensis TaxID=1472724 RepID=A0ABV8EMZ5_9BACT|nr:DinB family protein [Belliella kenyensis]